MVSNIPSDRDGEIQFSCVVFLNPTRFVQNYNAKRCLKQKLINSPLFNAGNRCVTKPLCISIAEQIRIALMSMRARHFPYFDENPV